MATGPEKALEIVDRILEDPRLDNYHLLPSARANFLKKLGRLAEARIEFERAAAMTRNEQERKLLLQKARECTA
jgi:predicted RNA polymerase sigma factor